MFIPAIFFLLLLLLLLAAVIIALYFYRKGKYAIVQQSSAAQKLVLLEEKVDRLTLQNLEAKLNPHLFKNILNSVQSHAYQTYFALDKLANVLDYILYESQNKMVSPQQEIEFALNYIDINKIKISPLFDLSVKTKIKEDSSLYTAPLLAPLITIDLIENAFKHADIQSSASFIAVLFECDARYFTITVSNKISGKEPMKKIKSGIGKTSLAQRLAIIYKDCFKLEQSGENEVYFSQLKINLFEYQHKMHTS